MPADNLPLRATDSDAAEATAGGGSAAGGSTTASAEQRHWQQHEAAHEDVPAAADDEGAVVEAPNGEVAVTQHQQERPKERVLRKERKAGKKVVVPRLTIGSEEEAPTLIGQVCPARSARQHAAHTNHAFVATVAGRHDPTPCPLLRCMVAITTPLQIGIGLSMLLICRFLTHSYILRRHRFSCLTTTSQHPMHDTAVWPRQQVGAIFALYCLYQTQPSRERVYLPLPALQQLTHVVPRLHTEGLHGALLPRHEKLRAQSSCLTGTLPCLTAPDGKACYRESNNCPLAADALAVLQRLHADSAFVVGALLRPPSASERARSAGVRAAVRAATADVQAEALVEREAKYHINSTLQVRRKFQCVKTAHGTAEQSFQDKDCGKCIILSTMACNCVAGDGCAVDAL